LCWYNPLALTSAPEAAVLNVWPWLVASIVKKHFIEFAFVDHFSATDAFVEMLFLVRAETLEVCPCHSGLLSACASSQASALAISYD